MADYIVRLSRALDYIEASLGTSFSLGEVAREAGMSAFHFSRTFHAITGEPVSDYVRKRRLTKAAALLRETDTGVLDIALEVGFEGQAAFSRAFARRYGLPPARFRRSGASGMLADLAPLSRAQLESLASGEISMEPRFAERPGGLFVGVSSSNTARGNGIPRSWRLFLPRLGELGAVDGATYGIYRYDFSAEDEAIGEDFPFEYLAGAELAAGGGRYCAPRGMTIWPLPAARYAVFVHRGLLRNLGSTYRYVYKTWFPRSGAEYARAPFFERRSADYPGDLPLAETEIWIPLTY